MGSASPVVERIAGETHAVTGGRFTFFTSTGAKQAETAVWLPRHVSWQPHRYGHHRRPRGQGHLT